MNVENSKVDPTYNISKVFESTDDGVKLEEVHKIEPSNGFVTCVICDISFCGTSDTLEMHMNDVHNGQKTTQKLQNNKDGGKQIEIVHEGSKVKKYSCKFCRKSYNHSTNLKFHLTKVHEGNMVKCDLCHETFTITQQNNLKDHICMYEGIQTLIKCKSCKNSYPNTHFKVVQDGNSTINDNMEKFDHENIEIHEIVS